MKPITIACVEDDNELREALAALLNSTPGYQCLAKFSSAEKALKALTEISPTVILADINLPGMTGIEFVARFKTRVPNALCVMLTVMDDAGMIFEALQAGASGYLLKGTPPSELLAAIADVANGGSPMSSVIARKVVRFFHNRPSPNLVQYSLSPRETEILEHLSSGKRYKEIAVDLGISEFTVRNHLRKIYDKLSVTSRTEALLKFLQK